MCRDMGVWQKTHVYTPYPQSLGKSGYPSLTQNHSHFGQSHFDFGKICISSYPSTLATLILLGSFFGRASSSHNHGSWKWVPLRHVSFPQSAGCTWLAGFCWGDHARGCTREHQPQAGGPAMTGYLTLVETTAICIYTSSSRASRWRKFQKKKELYSKERICL